MTSVFPRTIAAAVLAFVVQVPVGADRHGGTGHAAGPSRSHGPIWSRSRTTGRREIHGGHDSASRPGRR